MQAKELMATTSTHMNRREFLESSVAAVGLAACRRRDRRPNVVFILTDDQRWDCLGVAGHPFLKTPNLDRIANEGVRFANMFVTTSLCSPSRASFLSGLYAHTHGVISNFTEYPANLPSYPSALHAVGYETAYIGKWHMGENNDEKRPGFDYWISHKGQGKYYDNIFNVNGKRQQIKGYYTHVVTEMAVDWIKKPHRKPFLLCLGHKAPHGVWIPEPKYEHVFDNIQINRPATANDIGPNKPSFIRERIRTWHGIEGNLYGLNDFEKFVRYYHATILSIDDSVGAIYDALHSTGELDNTLLVFSSDNGFLLGEHASIDKRTMWEESIRVPLLLRYPNLAPEPKVIKEMVLNIDVAPSIVDICGANGLARVQGRSFRNLVLGRATNWRHSWYYEYNFEKEFPYTPNVRGVRTDEWKYIHYPNGDGQPDKYLAELYYLKEDPLEKNNLINEAAAQEQLTKLRAELVRLQVETGALPDRMPINPELRMELPEPSIR
jgi:N-acetylglucosamine-6-sulfatase